MKSLVTMGGAILLLSACQQSGDAGSSAEKGKEAATLPASTNICDRYFAFVEDYAGKQNGAIKDNLLKRLDYDKQSLPTRDKKEADDYCKQSLERMERVAR